MKIRLITGLAVHALACLLFVFLSWLGFYLYTQLFGALGSVGIAGAKAWLLVFMLMQARIWCWRCYRLAASSSCCAPCWARWCWPVCCATILCGRFISVCWRAA